MIDDIIARIALDGRIVFATANAGGQAGSFSDVDIYCVIEEGRSMVRMAYDDHGVWTEVFVDTLADLRRKLLNVDEIAINFIRELDFIGGDREAFDQVRAEIAKLVDNYQLPAERKNLLKYRIRVLLSKFLYPEADCGEQEQFLLNAMSYPLVQLALERHGIFPSSPKRWMLQLRKSLSQDEFGLLSRFIAHAVSRNDVIELCNLYAGSIEPINILKTPEANTLTFLS